MIHLIKNGTLKISGPRPAWANVEADEQAHPVGLAEAVNALQDADELAPYGFSEQKKRRLARIDELIEAIKTAIAEPDNADAQKLIDGFTLKHTKGATRMTTTNRWSLNHRIRSTGISSPRTTRRLSGWS